MTGQGVDKGKMVTKLSYVWRSPSVPNSWPGHARRKITPRVAPGCMNETETGFRTAFVPNSLLGSVWSKVCRDSAKNAQAVLLNLGVLWGRNQNWCQKNPRPGVWEAPYQLQNTSSNNYLRQFFLITNPDTRTNTKSPLLCSKKLNQSQQNPPKRRKERMENIQEPGFTGGHPPNYYLVDLKVKRRQSGRDTMFFSVYGRICLLLLRSGRLISPRSDKQLQNFSILIIWCGFLYYYILRSLGELA